MTLNESEWTEERHLIANNGTAELKRTVLVTHLLWIIVKSDSEKEEKIEENGVRDRIYLLPTEEESRAGTENRR